MASPYDSYVGRRGYSIRKNTLSIREQKFIRSELTVKPYLPKSPVQAQSFPIYRESPNKFYLPLYWAIDHFGSPLESKIDDYTSINMKFTGEPRDYQTKIIETYMKHISLPDINGGLLEVPCGRGKTFCGLYIAARLKAKTLVIVHKEFLLNQWVERIKEFIPQARIGRLQGQIIDIEDKDIVIAMLQSLSMKEYPADLFQSFGFTIVDEVHHISSEVFSRALSNVVTKYTLGLSATMQRKDGLSKVFRMFLGEVAYKEKSEPNSDVIVKAIHYNVEDEEFNSVSYDYRGNVKYSTMVSKLCSYNRRSEFIIKTLTHELNTFPNQQIMILAHQKALLVYLEKAIIHNNIASVGYYIGGMKEADLKKSESKTVILATYAMASEGLDIKTLSTLIMATPKTDITQSIGRILRVKHSRPLIIDIVDSHEPFEKQWEKRKKIYMQNRYVITTISSQNYPDGKWEHVRSATSSKSSSDSSRDSGKNKPKKCLIEMPFQ